MAQRRSLPPRRAVVRWAWRMFRREWRRQGLVLALLTVAVGAAVGGAAALWNTAGVSDDAVFGSATHLVDLDRPDPAVLADDIAMARSRLGATDVITRWNRPVPGSTEEVEYRGLDPDGAFVAPMLALVGGRYPTASDEVAVTDRVATLFGLATGDGFDLDGVGRTVVGVVENPSDLHDEFALVAPSSGDRPERATLLVDADGGAVAELVSSGLRSDGASVGERDPDAGVVAAAVVLGAAAVVMLLVALLATAGFVVVAQRRLRQLGMLAAVGADEGHLRLVMVANGVIVGLVAAVAGAAAGLGGWFVAAPRMEGAVGHRIDPFDVPWWVVAANVGLALVAATGAAWWPARAVARVPVTAALTGRPPQPQPAHRSAALAGVLLALGVVCLVRSGPGSTLLVLLGTVATVAGVLLASPLALRVLGSVARRLPVGPRLALRDLVRHQARSASAVAAISLVVGVPAAIIVTSSAAEHGPEEGNLSERQMLVWSRSPDDPEGYSPFYTEDPNDSGFAPFPPDLSGAQLAELEGQVAQLADELDAGAVPLDVAVDPRLEPSELGQASVTLAERTDVNGGGWLDVALLYVATPELLGHFGVDLGSVGRGTDVLTVEPGPVAFTNFLNRETQDFRAEPVARPQRLTAEYTSLPGSFVTPAALRERGWETVRIGWLLEADRPITDEDVAAARDRAVGANLLVEGREAQASLGQLRAGATWASLLLALAVLGMSVGLLRAEAGGDLRTLTATGASPRVRRSLTSATAGGLALLGVALGIGGAYVALGAGYLDQIGSLRPVPLPHLALVALGVPFVAAAAGYVVAGRDPGPVSRRPLD